MLLSKIKPRNVGRSAFTLIELLVVIVIIGILIGLLVPTLGPILWRTDEAVIQAEMKQIETAVEAFKTEFGFYPPDFSTIDSAADMKPYIRKISQNHAHTDADFTLWWNTVGTQIRANQGSELVFWLTAIRKSKQYPLFDPNVGPDTGYATNSENHQIFFDFDQKNLQVLGLVAVYMQPRVKVQPFVYFNSNTYATGTYNAIVPYVDTSGNYYNDSSFQLVAAGRDELFLDSNSGIPADDVTWPDDKAHHDNLSNFAGGIMQKVL